MHASLCSESKMSSASSLSPPPLFMARALVGCCIRIATQLAACPAAAPSSSVVAAAVAERDEDTVLVCLLDPPVNEFGRLDALLDVWRCFVAMGTQGGGGFWGSMN